MFKQRVRVEHLPLYLAPDPSRVITRFFSADEDRTRRRINRVLSLPEPEAEGILSDLLQTYGTAQPDLPDTWSEHFDKLASFLPPGGAVGRMHRLLVGAYFTMHYALEAAALFNPSIIPHLDQTGIAPGATRFILSLRAVGEGHLSSVVFRTGIISADSAISIDPPAPHYRVLNADPQAELDTAELRSTLAALGQLGPIEDRILARVGETFSVAELLAELERIRIVAGSSDDLARVKETLLSIVGSNYRIHIPAGIDIREAVLFTASANETRGIEDLRLVCFTEEDGSQRHYGTYTAYNGHVSYPTLFDMHDDGGAIESHTLVGKLARNKGMALFPRKIAGRYVMSGRVDGENLHILESSSVRVWNEGRLCMQPQYWWESSVIGNCGSPIETAEGWLLLTHGVGPMRQYCVGAALLDLDDPVRVIGRLREPLIAPADDTRNGYVPNVIYTCGAMVHRGTLIIPYAMSDMVTTFARVDLQELLDTLRASP